MFKFNKSYCVPFFAFALQSCAHGPSSTKSDDPFQWLEEVEGSKALEWVKAHNEVSVKHFEADPRFAQVHSELKTIAFAEDRIPGIEIRNGQIYNFWQDATHVQGIWRTTTLASYETKSPVWETFLDVDALSKQDGVQWVFKGAQCLMPDADRCLISLSKGGKDAAVTREFDIPSRSFVKDGFISPEGKNDISWKDRNTLWLGMDFGPGSLTTSGYPRLVKLWSRGTPVTSAKLVYEGKETDVATTAFTLKSPQATIDMVLRQVAFFESELYHYEDGKITLIPVPSGSELQGSFQGDLYFILRKEWKTEAFGFDPGSLIAFSLKTLKPRLVMKKPSDGRIHGMIMTKDHAFIQTLENIQSQIYSLKDGKIEILHYPFSGKIFGVMSAERWSEQWVVQAEHFLLPSSQYLIDGKGHAKLLKQSPARFDASHLVSEQKFATSKDGTKIPFFVVHKKGMKLDGKNPTLLNAYGGFEADHLPGYSGGTGKIWLERGGVYVRANIRGGGEYGPEWHTSAMKENRHRVFEDFFAVSEELIRLKITSPKHLGIMGGSNGGLLMGVALTQRPELFNAIVCQVPLLDMHRYSHLLAGASWMDEYGNPDVPSEWAYISKYSPYQNLDESKTYPEVYFSTSTKDDRVHPGHARKMVAKLESMHKPVLYFENMAGGHGGGANIEDHVNRWTFEFIYLMQKLMD